MNENAMPHLTDLELDDLLLGAGSAALQAHVDACPACRERYAAVATPIASFRDVSLAWAEQRSAAMPMPVLAADAAAVPAYASGQPSEHLSDDQLDEVMVSGAAPAAAAHLAACEPCTARLAALEQPIATFRAVSLAWSERRSATMPLGEPHRHAAGTPAWARRAGWAAMAAAALIVAVAVPKHRSAPAETARIGPATAQPAAAAGTLPAQAAAVAPSTGVTPSKHSAEELRRQKQIADDNQMLAAIDHELDASQAQLAAFGVDVSSGAASRKLHSPQLRED